MKENEIFTNTIIIVGAATLRTYMQMENGQR